MSKFSLLSLLTLISILNISCLQKSKEEVLKKDQINKYLEGAMKLHNIPGLALAVVEKGDLIYKEYLGKASIEEDVEVNSKTLFRVFSTSKLITATGIFQLIEDGKLGLEDRLSKYFENLPQEWNEVRIKNLLSHSSGLPDMIRFDSSLSDDELRAALFQEKMEFEIGSQFRYNQTNYWLLALIIEKLTGLEFGQYIIQNQFSNDSTGVLFSSNSTEAIPNRARRYFYNSKTQSFDKDTNNNGKRGHSGNGLNITLDRFIEWNKDLDEGNLLKAESKRSMWTPFTFSKKKDSFLHGWASYLMNGKESYGFSGGNLAAFRKFVDKKRTIILLSNGYQIPAYDIIVNDIARILDNEGPFESLALEEGVMKLLFLNDLDKAGQVYLTLKNESPKSNFDNVRWNINSLGNKFMYEGEHVKATEVFGFNTELNPEWWIAFAGLAEIHEVKKDTFGALEYYRRAVELNADNEWNYNEGMSAKISELQK